MVILYVVLGIIGGYMINVIREKIFSKTSQVIKEDFDKVKFLQGMLGINLVLWAKDIVSLLNIRKLSIYIIILTTVYYLGVYKEKQSKPVNFNLDYSKEFVIKLDSQELYKPKNSNNLYVRDKGRIIKVISAKDIPQLREKLKPYGLIFEPILIGGYLINGKKAEVGGGISLFKYLKNKIDTFITNKGVYIGTSYGITENSGVGMGIGVGYKDSGSRVTIYYRWRF